MGDGWKDEEACNVSYIGMYRTVRYGVWLARNS